MQNSKLCDYSNVYILVKRTKILTGRPADATDANNRLDKRSKGIVFKNNVTFTECISKINNTQRYKCCDANV